LKDFQNKVVLITGGTRGIGLKTAERFVDAGACVMVTGRREESVAKAEASLGAKVRGVAADVSTVDGCRESVAAALSAFGRLDILFANAGNYEAAPLDDVTEELWDRTIDTHLKGAFFSVQAAAPALRETEGCAVLMASDAGLLALPGGWAAYCAAKGGVVALTRSLAIDLAPRVRVNAVAPAAVGTEHLYEMLRGGEYGGFETAQDPVKAVAETLPLKRIIEPDEVADAVLFLATAKSITGAILNLDAGSTIGLPG
jgi:3-oxoacyl-[acyl-carrier protein] reductase